MPITASVLFLNDQEPNVLFFFAKEPKGLLFCIAKKEAKKLVTASPRGKKLTQTSWASAKLAPDSSVRAQTVLDAPGYQFSFFPVSADVTLLLAGSGASAESRDGWWLVNGIIREDLLFLHN